VDKYTTEIIAQEMTMLGGREGAGGAGDDTGAAPAPRSAPPARSAPAPAPKPAARPATGFDDMDDDIPF